MDFVYLRTFCEVAKWGTFTRAAEILGYGQPSVTMQIQKLEEQYGTVLFERYGRRMQLTQTGAILLGYAQQILQLQAEAKTLLSTQQAGTITIGVIETLAAFYLPALLQSFREIHPDITVTLQSGNEMTIAQSLKAGECDLGLILDYVSIDPELVSIPLRKEEFVLVTRPDSSYIHMQSITADDLANARFVLTEEGCTYRGLLTQALKQAGVRYQIACDFSSLEAIKKCVMCGLGIAFLPRIAVEDEVAQGKLCAIPFAYPHELQTQAIYLERKWQSRSFQDLLMLMTQAVH